MKEFGILGLRLHRNIGAISAPKRLLKQLWNKSIGALAYADYFGSFEDVEGAPHILEQEGVLEVMCHPDLDKDAVVVDRAGGSTYDAPFGAPMEQCINLIKKRM